MPLYLMNVQYPFLIASFLSTLAFLFIVLHPKVRAVQAEVPEQEEEQISKGGA